MPASDPTVPPDSPPDSGARSVPWVALRQRLQDAGLLDEIAAGPEIPPPDTIVLDHLTDDSRRARPGSLFAAIRGTAADGHTFIDKAISNGARLVLCEAVPEHARTRFPSTLFARTADSRAALAEVASTFYGDPSRQLDMVGITGTNGKTTVATLSHHLLQALSTPTGLISTIEVRTGTVSANAALTTPGPIELQRTLRRMVDDDCRACAMEVSSHALDQERVRSVGYDVAVFTNLTAEHLDYHESLQAYRAAKKKLFDGLAPGATAIVNADDPHAEAMVADTPAEVVTVARDREADVRVDILERRVDSLRLRINGRERTVRLAGGFNAWNLAAVYAVGRVLGHAAEPVLDVLADAPPVPGRFESLRFDDGTTVVVDYAHTPDALENILSSIRTALPADFDGTLWCVFGCGGDRDPSKRRVMGSIAEQRADRVVVTSDNPRTEDPASILNDIRRGMSRPAEASWIVDRDVAIRTVADEAAPGDVVLIAGKGHETVQVVGTETRPFDDREKARTYFGTAPEPPTDSPRVPSQ